MSSDLTSVLACPALPTLPSVAAELLRLTDDPDVKLDDIERLVSSDVGLSSRILRTINSSLYSLSTPCTSIKRAMAYLGLNAVKSLVLGFSMADLCRDLEENDQFDFRAYWRRVIYGASGARFIATVTNSCDPDETFTAAMFQDMGMVAMLVVMRDRYAQLASEVGENHEKLAVVEQLTLGFTHAHAGAELAAKWKMPANLTDVIRAHHAPADAPQSVRDMVRCIALGRIAAEALRTGASREALADLLVRAKSWFPKARIDTGVMLDRIAAGANDLASVLGQKVGPPPDVQEILAEANKQLFKQQMESQRQLFEAQQREQELTQAALTDGLTGIGNRKRFDQELARQWEVAASTDTPLSMLFVDADKFKPINDTHGHQAGDRILQLLAQRLTDLALESAVVCRYGGEEFAILVSGATEAQTLVFAERVRAAVADEPFDLREVQDAPDELTVTVSVGVASTSGSKPIASAAELLRLADEGVYAAKAGGRNRVCLSQGGVPAQTPATAASHTAAPLQSSAASAPQSAAAPTSLNPLRIASEILFVDDDALARALMQTLLSRQPGIERVRSVGTVIAALETLRKLHSSGFMPMAVICDMELRDKTALDVLRAARALPGYQSLPFIIITANPSGEVQEICRKAGASHVYSKDQLCRNLTPWLAELMQLIACPAVAG